MNKEIFVALQQRLSGVPHLKYISEDWGQLDNYSDRPPVKFPCVLFDIDQVEYTDNSRNVQEGTGVLKLRIADYRVSNLSHTADEGDRFEMLDLLNEIYKALQGLDGNGFSRLSRISLARSEREDSIREYTMLFRFMLTDDTAAKQLTRVEVGKKISVTTKR